MESITSGEGISAGERREKGRYYTPDWLALEIVRDGLSTIPPDATPTILDPSCGEGAFLLPAFDVLLERRRVAEAQANEPWAFRLQLTKKCLHGIDNDPAAIARLLQKLVERIAPPPSRHRETMRLLAGNFPCGDALTGAGLLEEPADPQAMPQRDASASSASLDWRTAFPAIAQSGGFDLILGNPPYRRERDARELFHHLAASPLGRKWRQPRMDLWHYFLHRSLDSLQPGGRLAFLVNGYWAAARSATPLIERLRSETTMEEIRRIDGQRLFEGVTGRHMAFRLRKGRAEAPCLLRNGSVIRTVPQHELFTRDRLVSATASSRLDSLMGTRPLGELFEVRQGIAENPPSIGTSHLRRWPGLYRRGEGVFVLTAAECELLKLSLQERALLRSYWLPRQLERYETPSGPEQWLLYLTRDTAPALEEFPQIARHLERFRPLLERRREVQRRIIAWWHLHWPREERLFIEPRILAVQMGYRPRFTLAVEPTFVGFSVNLIGNRKAAPETAAASPMTLPTLLGVLNCRLAEEWFQRHAKHRGANLDISGTLLRSFPLPLLNPDQDAAIGSLVKQRMEASTGDMTSATRLEQWIESLVEDAYALPR